MLLAENITLDSMKPIISYDSRSFFAVVQTTRFASVILADVILVCFIYGAGHCLNLHLMKVWHCYTMWTQPKMIFGMFSLLFLVDAGQNFKPLLVAFN